MKTIRALGDIACIALACIAVVIICFFVYYLLFNEDITGRHEQHRRPDSGGREKG